MLSAVSDAVLQDWALCYSGTLMFKNSKGNADIHAQSEDARTDTLLLDIFLIFMGMERICHRPSFLLRCSNSPLRAAGAGEQAGYFATDCPWQCVRRNTAPGMFNGSYMQQ